MKVLITGATGLVGSEIVNLCKQNNITVHYLTTRKGKIQSQEGYRGFYWNPDHNEIDMACFHGVTTVVNLAGASISKRWTRSNKKKIVDSRVKSLKTLRLGISKLKNHNINTIVSASAIGVYPNSLSNYYREAETGVDDSFLGKVVSIWEQEVDKFREINMQVAKIRIGLVMSDKGGALPQMAKPVKYYVGASLGAGNQWQSWIHIQDLARIFLHVATKELHGVYNAVAPNPVTNEKLTKEIAKVLGRPLLLPNVPRAILQMVLGDMSYILFASQRVSSKKIVETGFDFMYPNICRALENIFRDKENYNPSDTLYHKEYCS
ncbi:TIGR01777 family protein [Arenibacter aquaticus]|uniref:TIGR01777 family protein n=1 Tax=Arenibacter aquaticus TaxID=2489054 RepID=A0A430K1V7_9FLAO|nr:TIGR01777 family oxidoreductase [Arenibacter aquaticus]RTE53056.1 TIGR01777 family protein [Arenibacter aquaticus]